MSDTDNSAVTTIVAGFPRCGSSLVMRMLYAAGVPCAFDHPVSMELDAAGVDVSGTAWLSVCQGRAVKVLDPFHKEWPDTPNLRWIWIDRDPLQQAKSFLKFARTLGMPLPESALPALTTSLIRDRPKCMGLMARLGDAVLFIRFDEILCDPAAAADRLIRFTNAPGDAREVAKEVIARDENCLPYMLELSQIAATPTPETTHV